MDADDKIKNQNDFMSDKVRIIVATSAFGMGVDKKDVGLVVHYDISDSLENYVQEDVARHLTTNFMPDPDLLIRTGGELRVSNYLLWQIAYSELYFCDTYWPDFCEADLHKAIASYQGRQRRFGKTEEQVENDNNTPVTK